MLEIIEMAPLLKRILIVLSIVIVGKTFCQNNDGVFSQLKTKVKAENIEGNISLSANIENTNKVFYSLDYLFIAIKKDDNGNTSSSKQEGKFVLDPHESKVLSQIKMNLGKNGGLKCYLFIRDQETSKLLVKDSLHINAESFISEKTAFIPENKVELNGFTLDETKTKQGKYFYDELYMNILQEDFKFGGTVLVSELPSMGRNSRILLSYNDQEIYQFMTTPDEELINEEAKKSLLILKQYLFEKKSETN